MTVSWTPLAFAGEEPGGPSDEEFEGEAFDPEQGVEQGVEQGESPDEHWREQSGSYFLVSPGLVQVPLDTLDVGYQWGFAIGHMVRSDSRFALGLGLNFEHGISDLGDAAADLKPPDFQFRVQGEIMPGLEFFASRMFLHLSLGLGYVGWMQRWTVMEEVRSNTEHGIAFSPAVGSSGRIWGTFTIGAQVGVDLQWMRVARTPFDAHNLDAKITLGWMY